MTPSSILVVEDERIIAKGIEKRLKGLGYVVAGSAANGDDAVRMAVELRPDLILMDISLGSGIDGVTAAEAIRTRVDAPIVYLTAFSDDATLQRAKRTEPVGYILKPYEDKDLQIAIEIGLYKHKMDRRLREHEQWLAATLGSIGDGVIATDEAGRVRFLNAVAEALTGWKSSEAVGQDIRAVFQIVDEKTRAPVPNPVLNALATGECVTLAPNTLLIDKADFEWPIDDSAAPIRDANGKMVGSVLVFRDITERRRLEDHLRQAQKMEAVGRLAGGIAHDFNNIMTVIIGYSELLLLGDGPSAADGRESLRHINEAGKRAAALTQQIMAFSRKQVLVPCVLNLNAIVRDMAAMVKRLIGSHIEFAVEAASDLGSVKADPTQVGQIILNLAANARDAMPMGGKLVLSTANVALDETTRPYPDVTPGRYAVLTVSDTGIGMSAEVMAHVFEPFYTTKGVGQGTGLGLATVYGIVAQSHGHIAVASAVGVGTTFRIYFPIVAASPSAVTPASDTRIATTGTETILLVEDDETVRQMTKFVLERSGYAVLEAANGLDAVTVAERYRGSIQLLITDLVMPQLSGRQVAERLFALRRDLRVLFMSGYTDDMIVQQGIESATVDFLHKPFKLTALTDLVREILDRPDAGKSEPERQF